MNGIDFHRTCKAVLGGLTVFSVIVVSSPLPVLAQQAPSVRFQSLNPPYADFVISVPVGWGFRAGAYENPITVWVTGLAEDIIAPQAVAGAQASFNTCNQIAQVMSVHTTKWSASGSLPVFISYLRRKGTAAQITSHRPLGSQSVDATARIVEGGMPLDSHLVVSMIWVPSPSYSSIVQMAVQRCPGRVRALPAWESFAFLTSCSAPAGSLARWERTCAAILSSFYPHPNWLVAYARQFATQMKTSAAVDQLVSGIRQAGQKQLQGQLDYMESNWNSMRQRRAALEGDVLLRTQGGNEIYRPNVFDTWCEDSAQYVFGTNAPTPPPNCAFRLPKVGTR
jgi:hypothetical protein